MQLTAFSHLTSKLSMAGALQFMQPLFRRPRPRPAYTPSRTAVTAEHRAQIGAHFKSHNAREIWDNGSYVIPDHVRAHGGRISVNFRAVDGKLIASVEHYRSRAERMQVHRSPVAITDHDADSLEAIHAIALLGDC